MYNKIWVTGGSGLLGTAFQSIKDDYPEREFLFTSSKVCNLTNSDNTLDYAKSHQPDAIIHLAAFSGGIGLNLKYPATLLRDNALMNVNILEASRILGVKKTVMTLSTAMYPTNAPIPILEEYIYNGHPHESNYGYAYAKRLAALLAKAYRYEYGLNVIGLVPNGIVGENMNYRYGSSTVTAALIRRFYESREGDSKIIVWGDGSSLREFTNAKDMARAYMWCLDNYDSEQILNIGSTEEYSIKEIAYMVAQILGIDTGRIQFDTSKPSGQFRKSTDNSKFLRLSNFKYTPFKVALEKTIKYFCDNYETGRLRL